MDPKEFLDFKSFITPVIIKILFWIGVVLCVLIGLVGIVRGAGAEYGGGGMVISGLLTLFLGPIAVRVYCELLILAFKIFDTLKGIEKNTSKTPPTA